MKKVTGKRMFINKLSIVGAVFLLGCTMPGISARAAITHEHGTITGEEREAIIIVDENKEYVLDNAQLTVTKNATINGSLVLKNGSTMVIEGDYLQGSGELIVESGCKVEVKGDFRLQAKKGNLSPTYSTSSGSIETKSGAEIRIGKDLVIDTSGDISSADGDYYVDGSVSLEIRDAKDSKMNLHLTNNEPQTLSISENLSVGSLTSTCPTVNVNKYININTIKNDITFTNAEKVLYISRGLNKSDKNKVTYDGSLIVAGPTTEKIIGDSILRNDQGGQIIVNGDLRALKGKVEIDGSLDVAGSLLFEQQDSDGKAQAVTSSLAGGSNALITVANDFIWNSKGSLLTDGKMELAGNYTDKQGKKWLGTVKLVNKEQYVTIQNSGKINILEVAYSKGDYYFNPDKCWVKLVEGVPSEEPPTEDDNPGNTSPGEGNSGDNNSGGSGKVPGDLSIIDLISIIGNNPSQGSGSGSGSSTPAETAPATQPQTTQTTQDANTVNASNGKLDKSMKVVKISKISTKSKQLTVKYKKISDISGYEYQCSTSKKFKNAKTKKIGAKKTSCTVKKLGSGKTYYVRMRIYKNTPEGKRFSQWSKVKKIKVK